MTFTRRTLLSSGLLCLVGAASASAEPKPKEIALKIKGWDCYGCARSTVAALKKHAGVQEVLLVFKKKRVFVRYLSEKKTDRKTVGALLEVVKKRGFTASIDRRAKWPKAKSP